MKNIIKKWSMLTISLLTVLCYGLFLLPMNTLKAEGTSITKTDEIRAKLEVKQKECDEIIKNGVSTNDLLVEKNKQLEQKKNEINNALITAKAAQTEAINKVTSLNTELEQKINKINDELIIAKEAQTEATIRLRNRNYDRPLQIEIKTAEEKQTEATTKVTNLEAELQEAQTEDKKTEINNKLQAAKEAQTEAINKVIKFNAELETKKTKIKAAEKEEADALAKRINLEAELQAAQTEIKTAEKEEADAITKIINLEAELKTINDEIVKNNNQIETDKNDVLAKIKVLENEVIAITKELNAAEEEEIKPEIKNKTNNAKIADNKNIKETNNNTIGEVVNPEKEEVKTQDQVKNKDKEKLPKTGGYETIFLSMALLGAGFCILRKTVHLKK